MVTMPLQLRELFTKVDTSQLGHFVVDEFLASREQFKNEIEHIFEQHLKSMRKLQVRTLGFE